MGIASRIRGAVKAAGSWLVRGPNIQDPTAWLTTLEIQQLFGGGMPHGSPFRFHAWVRTCVWLWGTSLAAMPFRLYTGSPDDRRLVEGGPWARLFRRPNPQLKGGELMQLSAMHLALTGESFWFLEGAGDTLGDTEIPMEIWPVSGACVVPIRDLQTRLIVAWEYRDPRTGLRVERPFGSVVHHRLINPEDHERGLAPLEAARLGVESDTLAAQWNRSFFKNGATIGTAMVLPATAPFLTPEQIEQIRKEFDDKHQGVGRAHRTKILQGGATLQNVGASHSDMGFLEQRRWGRDEVASVFQVPQFLLGLTNDLKYATARESRRVLYENLILHLASMIEGNLEADLFERRLPVEERARAAAKGQRLLWGEFDSSVVEALRDAYTERLGNADRLILMGWPRNVVNDHLELGLPAIEGDAGEKGTVSFGLSPLEAIFEEAAPVDPLEDEEPALELPELPGEDDEEEPEPDSQEDDEEPPRALRQARVDVGHRRRRRTWLMLATRVYAPGERQFQRVVRKHFRRVGEDISRELGKRSVRKGVSELDAFLARMSEKWDAHLRALARPAFRDTVARATAVLAAELGGFDTFDLEKSPEIGSLLRERELKITRVDDTMLGRIRETLAAGIGESEPVTALRDRLEREMGLSFQKAKTIARTEVSTTSNQARWGAAREEGVKTREWVSTPDHKTRHSHSKADGQVVGLDQAYQVGSSSLRFPGDPEGPPGEIVNCRCAEGFKHEA